MLECVVVTLSGSSVVMRAQQHSHASSDSFRRLLCKALGRYNWERAAHAAALPHCASLSVCRAEPQAHYRGYASAPISCAAVAILGHIAISITPLP